MTNIDKGKTDIVYFAEHVMKLSLTDPQKKILKDVFDMAHGNGIYSNDRSSFRKTAGVIILNHTTTYLSKVVEDKLESSECDEEYNWAKEHGDIDMSEHPNFRNGDRDYEY